MAVYETLLICYDVFTAADDPRAADLLHQGYCLLQVQAAQSDDEALRDSVLAQVATNRTLMAQWAALP